MTTATYAPKTIKTADRMKHIKKARQLVKQLGMRSAAGFLRNKGWSIDATMFILCGK